VDDLNSIIEELQEKNFVLIGESYGAAIAIKYVTKYPGKVSKLVLIGGTSKVMSTDDFPHGLPPEVIYEMQTLAQKSYSKFVRFFNERVFPEPGTEYLKELGFRMFQKTPQEIAMNVANNFLKGDVRPLLGKVNIPTLILHGENDGVCPLEGAKYMHEKIPGSKMYIFKEKGHLPNITAPDKFNKILEKFIRTGQLLKD